MGDPKKSSKKWGRPGHPWIRERLQREMELVGKYGLRNKRELWITQTMLREIRRRAKELLSLPPELRDVRERALALKLYKLGILDSESASVEDILGLDVEVILERRLQTIVFKRGLARSIHHARQLITHGHIAVGMRKVRSPGYLVSRDEEGIVGYVQTSPYVSSR